jgi:serine/threonine protein kinase
MDEDWRITIVPSMGALFWVRDLGYGSEGSAELYLVKATGATVVVKKHRDEAEERHGPTKRVTNEINIAFSVLQGKSWFTCRHQTWYFETGASVARVVSEFCAGGDLNGIMFKYMLRMVRFPESLVWHIFLHIGTALLFLHTGKRYDPESGKFIDEEVTNWNPVIHRDVRDPNILIRFNDIQDGTCYYPDFVLNDLGLAAPLHEHAATMFDGYVVDSVYPAHTIPDAHCPPEVRNDREHAEEKVGTQWDWFMLGFVLKNVMTIGISGFDITPTKFSDELKTLVQSLTHVRPQKRVGDEEALNGLPRAQEVRDDWMQREGSSFPGWVFGRAQPAMKKRDAAEAPKTAGSAAVNSSSTTLVEEATPVYEEYMLEDALSDLDDSMEDADDLESIMTTESVGDIHNSGMAMDDLQPFY